MDFAHSDKVRALQQQVTDFMDRYVYAAEPVHAQQVHDSGTWHFHPPIMEELKAKAKAQGLWNLFLPHSEYGAGLNNLEYSPLCEIMGRSLIAPEVFNCNAPDTGNMEILAEYGSREQKKQWLEPMLEGTMRGGFSMTEPETPGSDPTQLISRAERKGNEYIINGHKWFTTNALHPNCKVLIAMLVTNPDAAPYKRASMIMVPMDTPGVRVERALPVFNHSEVGGHGEIYYENVRVPVSSLLGPEGEGFTVAQARLGPGRIHHCMRAIGGAERALDLLLQRAQNRWTHGSLLSEKGAVQTMIAESRVEIEQARLLVLYTAWKMDTVGKSEARREIAMVKNAAARMFQNVTDRAIQVHGAMGMTNDVPLANLWVYSRLLRLGDGPDEVHNMSIARRELRRMEAISAAKAAS